MRHVGLVLLLLGLAALAAVAEAPTLDECDAMVRDKPREAYSYYCYFLSFLAYGEAEETERRLESILAANPDLHRVKLFLAWIEESRGGPRAESLYLEAMDGMEARGDLWGLVYGGTSFAFRLGGEGRIEEAEAQLERAARAAEAIDQPEPTARVLTERAVLAKRTTDYGRAWSLYRQAEALVFPEGPPDLQGNILSGLGWLAWGFGDLEAATEYYRREADVRRRADDRYQESSPLYNVALIARESVWRGEMEESEAEELARNALGAAVRGGNLATEAYSRILIAESLEGEAAIAELETALAIGDRSGELPVRLHAMRSLAERIATTDPARTDEAFRMVDRAIEEGRDASYRFQVARGLATRAYLTMLLRTREESIEAHLDVLDELERVRELQPEDSIRARVQATWSFPYYRLTGSLLETVHESASPDADLDLAFRTMERMRARVMLDSLEMADAGGVDRDSPLFIERASLLEEISAVQRRLMDRTLPPDERAVVLAELSRLEIRETGLRDRIARADPFFASYHAPSFPSLDQVREALGEHRALLSFQLWGQNDRAASHLDFRMSWLVVVTREGVRALPLPERRVLETQVDVFEGLLENRDGSEARAAARLYRDLLEEALEEMPEPVRQLVVIPDGALHRLPFGLLREDPRAAPLVTRYEVSIVPSATLWLRWTEQGTASPPPARALSLADPEIAGDETEETLRMAVPWAEGLRLGRLPFAREEARELARGVGGDSQVLTGADASERFLKETDLGDYGILHLAAHAVVDEDRPYRSAVLLAAGDSDEDGLLQIREIVDLHLDGRVVLLTGCRSASGEVLDGEGVMGLARAFFQAGAVAVVGSLWPLRDDEAALVMEPFSRELARGKSVAAALAAAKRSRIDAGAPTAAWAGLVVLGDGDVVPIPDGGRPGWVPVAWLAVLLAGLLVLAAVTRLVIRRTT